MSGLAPSPQPVLRAGRAPVRRRGWQAALASPGLPLVAVFWGYPVLWLMGVQVAAWPLVAVLLVVWTLAHRSRVLVPRGFGVWALFLGWTVVSSVTLGSPDRIVAWGYREMLYLAATGILVFLVNATEADLSTRAIGRMLIALWVATVIGGVIGIAAPSLQITSLAGIVLPNSISSIPFVADQITPRFGEEAQFLQTVRPAALYGYTNSWGAALAMLTPLALYARRFLVSPLARTLFWVLVAVSLIPIVVSVNRGLWIGLAVAALTVAIRAAVARRPGPLLGVVGAATTLGLTVWFSPLRAVIEARLNRPNTGTRETLAASSLELVARSPVLGYGAPVSVEALDNSNDVSVGTHGQLWTLLVSHGVPGATFYFAFLVFALYVTWRIPARAWWAQASIVVFATQAPFYNAIPVPMVLTMVAIAICLRERASARASTGAPARGVRNALEEQRSAIVDTARAGTPAMRTR